MAFLYTNMLIPSESDISACRWAFVQAGMWTIIISADTNIHAFIKSVVTSASPVRRIDL